MNRAVMTVATVAVITALAVISMIYSNLKLPERVQSPQSNGPVEKLSIAFVKNPFSASIAVAQAKGFFLDEGLIITLVPFTAGISGIDSVLSGQTSLTCASEAGIVRALMNNNPLRVAAVMSTSEMAVSIVGLKSRGISARSDLKGKKIGVTPGTSAEFNLSIMLTLSRIPLSEVHLIDLRPEEMEAAVAGGRVDAVSTWEPYITQMLEQFGPEAIQFYNTPPVTVSHILVTHRKLTEENPLIIEKFLRALIRAESFISESPDEASSITAGMIGMNAAALRRTWNFYNHEVKLDQNLIVRFEVMARWLTAHAGGETDSLPNFLDYIYEDGLMAADPEKVTLVYRESL